MSSQKHPLTNSKECWTFVVAAAITALLYVALIITISKEVHLRGFLFLEAGTTAKIFEFYAENLRGSLFTGFLALGGFLSIGSIKHLFTPKLKYHTRNCCSFLLPKPQNLASQRLKQVVFWSI